MNIATAIILLILIGVMILAARKIIRDKKTGKGCCGSCNSCAGCHNMLGGPLPGREKE